MTRAPTCEGCGCPLIWATSTKNGKAAPIVKAPDTEKGNVLLYREQTEERRLMADALPRDLAEALRERGVPLRLNHFADRPRAGDFRS